MRSKFAGASVLQEVVRAIGTYEVIRAVAEAACAKPLESQLAMHEDPAGHLFMKQLLQREAEAQLAESTATGEGGGPWFADALLEQATGYLSAWAGKNRGGFVVAALEKVPSAAVEVRRVMGEKGARAQLVKDAKAGTSMGVKVLAEQLGFGDFGAKEAAAAFKNKKPRKKG